MNWLEFDGQNTHTAERRTFISETNCTNESEYVFNCSVRVQLNEFKEFMKIYNALSCLDSVWCRNLHKLCVESVTFVVWEIQHNDRSWSAEKCLKQNVLLLLLPEHTLDFR